jgi:hypothetical protein
MTRLPVVVLFVGCAAPTLLGCTAIGAGIGAAVPRYERVEPPYDASLKEGASLHLTPKPAAADAEPIAGDYVGADDGELTLKTANDDRTIPAADIGEVKKRSGSQWFIGFWIGLLVDLTVATLVVVQVTKEKPTPPTPPPI